MELEGLKLYCNHKVIDYADIIGLLIAHWCDYLYNRSIDKCGGSYGIQNIDSRG